MRHTTSVSVLAAFAGVLAGCGQTKVARSHQPVRISGPPTTAGASPPSASKGLGHGRTMVVTGRDVMTKFGDVQVAVALSHGKITGLRGVRLPFDRRRSAYISQQASPILRQEVLAAQSAHINLVSGATYTSDAWATSVQAALNQAG